MLHKEAFFSFLHERWTRLFDARFDVLLYALTSTCSESDPPFEDKRQFGYSRDKRSDCVQVVIALIVTPDGFPLACEVMPGPWYTRATRFSMWALRTQHRPLAARSTISILSRNTSLTLVLQSAEPSSTGYRQSRRRDPCRTTESGESRASSVGTILGLDKLLEIAARGLGAVVGPLLAPWRARREGRARIIAAEADAKVLEIEGRSVREGSRIRCAARSNAGRGEGEDDFAGASELNSDPSATARPGLSDLAMTATWCEIAATSIVFCRADVIVPSARLFGVLVVVRSCGIALGAWRYSDSSCAAAGRRDCSGYGFCAEPAINDAQSLGGSPCASILANTVYGSVLLPADRNVRSSFIHA